MSALSPILRQATGGTLLFWCPGCSEAHAIQVGAGAGPRWGWNNSVDKPTFTPSILVTSGHYMATHKAGDSCWCTYNAKRPLYPSRFRCRVCHSFITNGAIRFLGDCTHSLAGVTVPMVRWPAGAIQT